MNATNTTGQGRPLVWGHRGAMAFAPQNTIPSFLLAAEQGADGVELDVQLTKDGVAVVFHDARLEGLTNGRGPVGTWTWTQLRGLDAGSHFGPGWHGTRIPTLEEVLAALPASMTVNVELKTSLSEETWFDRLRLLTGGPRPLPPRLRDRALAESAPLAEATAAVLAQGPASRFLLSSFDPFALMAVAPRLPRVGLGFLQSPTLLWDTPALVAPLPYGAWHPHHSLASAEAVRRDQAAGRRVHVWTVNDPAQARVLAQRGVDALITNRPAEVRQALEGVTARG